MMTTLARSATAIAALLMVGSSTMFAQSTPSNEVLSAYYGNTLTCRTAATQCHIWFNSDGTYLGFEATVATNGSVRLSGVQGEFKVTPKDGGYQACLNPRTHDGPARGRSAECYQLGSHKPGDAWDAKASDGTVTHFTLEAGHHVNARSEFL